MRFDLHLHTTASDGHLSPSELVDSARAVGLTAMAITDHDTTASVGPAIDASRGTDLLVIPGVELSATSNDRDVHILGYFIDPDDQLLATRLGQLRAARLERARTMVAALREGGYSVTLDQVLALAEGGAVGRSHVARALVEHDDVTDIATAFQELIGHDRPYYMAKPVTAPDLAIRTIREAGGLAILAHPGVTLVDDLLPALVDAGLAGIEAFHADHSQHDRARYASWARDLGLLVTGGSDFHGDTAPGAEIGGSEMPANVLIDLLAAGGWSDRVTLP